MDKSTEQWKDKLTAEQYNVLFEKGTEARFSGKYLDNKEKGMYTCAACGASLFDSDTKYDSKSGWPSFYDADKSHVAERDDRSHGMNRTEVYCNSCGGHLGHVFNDGPNPTGQRYCVNSLALDFKKKDTKKGEE